MEPAMQAVWDKTFADLIEYECPVCGEIITSLCEREHFMEKSDDVHVIHEVMNS